MTRPESRLQQSIGESIIYVYTLCISCVYLHRIHSFIQSSLPPMAGSAHMPPSHQLHETHTKSSPKPSCQPVWRRPLILYTLAVAAHNHACADDDDDEAASCQKERRAVQLRPFYCSSVSADIKSPLLRPALLPIPHPSLSIFLSPSHTRSLSLTAAPNPTLSLLPSLPARRSKRKSWIRCWS